MRLTVQFYKYLSKSKQGARTSTKSILYTNMGSTAAITPAEGQDSPLYMSSVSESDGRLRKPDSNNCYTYHAHPQFVGLSCSGPAYQYWKTDACGVCNPELLSGISRDDIFASTHTDYFPVLDSPQSGVFPVMGYYDGFAIDVDLLYDDGSVVLEAFKSVRDLRDAYYAYYDAGNYTLPPPIVNWYQDAYSIARRIKRAKIPGDKPQSGEMDVNQTHHISESKTQILTTFDDDTRHFDVSYDADRDNTYYAVDSDDVSLSKFLSRPVKVFQKVYTPNGAPATTIDVILPTTYFSNKRVVNRMTNYRNIKMDLCFRFMVNGSPFHYGRWMATAISNVTNETFLTPTSIQAQLNPMKCLLSQPPHVFINPTTGQGGCLRLPYVHHFNAFESTTGEHLNTGFIALTELSPLKQLSTALDTVTLTVVCWAENVVLGAPTASNIVGLVPQSGDEYGNNVISNTLTTLASVSGMLANICVIRPYALASKEILTRASQIAIALGFSKPNIVDNMMLMVPRTVPNLSSAVQHDPVYKLTYDDKQEVTHDPSVCGLARTDEMNISTLCQIPAYVAVFGWRSNQAPETTFLHLRVTPNHFIEGTGGVSARMMGMPPVCYISQLFRQWRGSIRFRFVAVASSFHRGRLRISYDPNGITAAQVTAGVEYNTTYSYIWDLSENHEAVIDVGYMSNVPYLRPMRPGNVTANQQINASPVTHDTSFDNGALAVTVLNDLTANGIAVPDIDILLFVSAGPDFQLYDPTDGLDNYTLFPQSGELMQDDLMSPLVSQPHVVFGSYVSERDKAPLVHHGDAVHSLRYLLKRYTAYFALPMIGIPANGTVAVSANMSAFPMHKGKAPGGMHTAAGGAYNFVYQTPLAWFSAMFMMRRGGLRMRVRDSSAPGLAISEMRAVRNTSDASFSLTALVLPAPTTPSLSSRTFINGLTSSGAAGMALASTIDGGRSQVDFEIPYHSARRFYSPRLGDNSLNHNQGVKIQALVSNTTTAARSGQLSIFVSAADDFSLSGFVSCPPVYFNPTVL